VAYIDPVTGESRVPEAHISLEMLSCRIGLSRNIFKELFTRTAPPISERRLARVDVKNIAGRFVPRNSLASLTRLVPRFGNALDL